MSRRPQGFTLVEIMLVIAMIAVVVGISVPVYSRVLQQSDLTLAKQAIIDAGRQAATYAQVGHEGRDWGIRVRTGEVILFAGTSYGARDPRFDDTFSLSPTIVLSREVDIIFSQVTGFSGESGELTITASTGESTTITFGLYGTAY
jgi:prepilin-type N-terminal cleavage/methylation domain-containing protein